MFSKRYSIASIIFFVLTLSCHAQKQNNNAENIDTSYLDQWRAMQSVNAQNLLISSIVKDTFGRDLSISDLAKGHLSVIKLWASWCTPCIESMPRFQSMKEHYSSNGQISFYTISLDHIFNDFKSMIQKHNWKIDHYWAGSDENKQIYQLAYEKIEQIVTVALPNYIILDTESKVMRNINASTNPDESLLKILNNIK